MSLIKVKGSSVIASSLSSIPAGNLTGTLPAISGANLTGLGGGITEADQWRVSSGFSDNANPISSNWERNDSTGFNKIGTGMSESSGIFTFPSTGIYLITWGYIVYSYGSCRSVNEKLEVTTNNSSYSEVSMAQGHINNVAALTYTNAGGSYIFDVTDTGQCKCRFEFTKTGDATGYTGDSTYNENHHTFIRLGDT